MDDSFIPDEEIGVTGLEEFSGYVDEEKLLQLRGQRAVKIFRQMADNDATIGAILFAFEMLMRSVKWRVDPASDSPDDKENAEFVRSCMNDMSHSWSSFISESVSFLTFGWAAHEIVYKTRLGPDQKDPTKRSNYNDGMIGWRKLPIRAQETLEKWEFDEDGGTKGLWQQTTDGGNFYIPIQKLLLFRTTSRKNNPEGRSVLRSAYTAWYRKKEIEKNESIGIERDLAGIPVMRIPSRILEAKTEDTKRLLAMYKKIVRNLRNDEQSGVILPSTTDDKGNPEVSLSLLGTGSARSIDTNSVIMRYKQDIASSILADVILLGHEKVGSFALADSKTHLLAIAIGAFLEEQVDVLNRFGIPRLFNLNDIRCEKFPQIAHSDIETRDLLVFSQALASIVASGGIVPGGEGDEKFFRELFGMPEAVPQFDLPNLSVQETTESLEEKIPLQERLKRYLKRSFRR